LVSKMMEKTNFLEKALKLVGKKFDLLIIDSLASNKGKRRFNQMLKDIPSSNPRMLSLRLKELERNGLVTKSLVLGTPVKTEYALTERAEELAEITSKLKLWAEKH